MSQTQIDSVTSTEVVNEEPLRPNATTKAAMLDAEEGRTETVTLDDLRDVIR